MTEERECGIAEDVLRKVKDLAWAALIGFLSWLVKRLVSRGGSSSRDADSGE